MKRRRDSRPALLVRVLTEIGRGHISEGYIRDKDVFIHGETYGRHIRINPAVATCDTLIHEALHRLEPAWSEVYVRRTTTYLLRRMSDEQVEALYEAYQQIAKRRRKRARSGVPTTTGRLVEHRAREGDVQEVRGRKTGDKGNGLQGGADVLPGVRKPLVASGTRQAVARCMKCGTESTLTAGGAYVDSWDGTRGGEIRATDECGDCRHGAPT